MKKELLEIIKCPYCGTDFEIKEVYSGNEEEIINGYIKCECNEYPILECILILENTPTKKFIIKYLKKNEIKKAIALPFGNHTNDICKVMDFIEPKLGGKFFKKGLLTFINRSSKKRYKRYSNKNSSFYNIVGNDLYGVYVKHRFSLESFWSIYPFIPLLKKNRKRILDMCCGVGHASFVISTYVNPQELVCVDRTFSSLYLAKKYFVPDAEFVCLDGNYPLPFKDDIFSSAVMMDGFHYIDARALLATELERVLSSEGLLLLLHVHNSLVYNLSAGKPLPPSVWINLFNALDVKALPEKKVVEDFILRDKLDLLKEYSENEINSSNAIHIIGSKNKSLFDIYKKIGNDFRENKGNLIINPLYKIRKERKKIVLERVSITDLFIGEYPIAEKYLPERYTIDNDEVIKALKGREVNIDVISEENLRYIKGLMMKFVIINAPPKYV